MYTIIFNLSSYLPLFLEESYPGNILLKEIKPFIKKQLIGSAHFSNLKPQFTD